MARGEECPVAKFAAFSSAVFFLHFFLMFFFCLFLVVVILRCVRSPRAMPEEKGRERGFAELSRCDGRSVTVRTHTQTHHSLANDNTNVRHFVVDEDAKKKKKTLMSMAFVRELMVVLALYFPRFLLSFFFFATGWQRYHIQSKQKKI